MNLAKIGFGGASLSGSGGGYGLGAHADPDALVKSSIEYGITHFDTAPIYGHRQSEKVFGETLKGVREKVKIFSKGGITWHSNKRVNLTNEPEVILSMLEQSLRDLKTDYLDGYYIHYPDPRIDTRYALEVLVKAKEQGKILNIGLSNTNNDEITKAQEICDIDLIQQECNLFNNAHDGINLNTLKVGWGTFDKGILSKTVDLDRKFSKEDVRAWAPWWKKSNWKEKVNLVKDFDANILKSMSVYYATENTDISLVGIKNIDYLNDLVMIFEELAKDKTKFKTLCDEFINERRSKI